MKKMFRSFFNILPQSLRSVFTFGNGKKKTLSQKSNEAFAPPKYSMLNLSRVYIGIYAHTVHVLRVRDTCLNIPPVHTSSFGCEAYRLRFR